jgi:hypothetical protein F3_00887
MEKENVLEIEFVPVWDKWAWRITKQNEEILIRNNFKDEELKVESFHSPEFLSFANKLFVKGSAKSRDDDISICNQEEKALIEEKVKAINEKYGIKKRWRADKHDLYYFLNSLFEIQETVETRNMVDIERYQKGNYFREKEEAEEYLEYIKKGILEWHEKNTAATD